MTMTEAEILEQLANAFAEASLDLDVALHRSLALQDIDGLDSISRVRLLLSVEDLFTVEITPRENGRLKTIGDLIDLIDQKCRGSTQ